MRILIFVLTIPSFSNGDNLIIPKRINDQIIEDGCAQMSNFYTTLYEAIRGVPFVWDLNNKTVENYFKKTQAVDTSFAVWCKRVEKGSVVYLKLANIESELNPFSTCSREIKLNIGYVGGLSVSKISEVQVSKFRDAESRKYFEGGRKVSGFAIRSENYGAGYEFYCDSNSNKWMFISYD